MYSSKVNYLLSTRINALKQVISKQNLTITPIELIQRLVEFDPTKNKVYLS